MFIANAVAEIEVNASDNITGDDDIEDDDVVIDENHDVDNVDHEPSRDIVSLDSAESDSVTVACSSTTKNSSFQLPYAAPFVLESDFKESKTCTTRLIIFYVNEKALCKNRTCTAVPIYSSKKC